MREPRVLDLAMGHGERLATVGGDGTLRVWDARSGGELVRVGHDEHPVDGAKLSPDGGRIATTGHDGSARLWDGATGNELARLNGVVAVGAFSPDGRRLATQDEDGAARVWDANDGSELNRMEHGRRPLLSLRPLSSEYVLAVAFSPDGRRTATAAEDGTARVWDSEGGREVVRVSHKKVFEAAFTDDGRGLITGGEDGTVRVWDIDSGVERARITGSPAGVSADGRRIATAGRDDTLRVWDVRGGAEVARLQHAKLSDWAFSSDGRRLATAGDGTARVWDAGSGAELTRVAHPRIEGLALSPDAHRLATADRNGSVRVWDVDSGVEVTSVTHPQEGLLARMRRAGGAPGGGPASRGPGSPRPGQVYVSPRSLGLIVAGVVGTLVVFFLLGALSPLDEDLEVEGRVAQDRRTVTWELEYPDAVWAYTVCFRGTCRTGEADEDGRASIRMPVDDVRVGGSYTVDVHVDIEMGRDLRSAAEGTFLADPRPRR